jgi:hypothetical protein
MGELTAELCEQQKLKIERLENHILTLENGELIAEARNRNHELASENEHLQDMLDDAQSTLTFYKRIIGYFLSKSED